MADYTVQLSDSHLQAGLARAVDREGKIPRAIGDLGPVADRLVVVLHADEGLRVRQLEQIGAHVTAVPPARIEDLADESADVVVSCWSGIRPGDPAAVPELRQVERVLRRGGRLLVVHDYGRDDVTELLGTVARERELVGWSDRRGPFLDNGFRLRVLHCWWSWDTLLAAAEFLGAAFGEPGVRLAAAMRRPRLSYKVAIYHRSVKDADARAVPGAAA